jgi:hypothetical protein
MTFGQPNAAKRINKVVAWVIDNGEYDFLMTYWSNYRNRAVDSDSVLATVNQGITDSGALYGSAIWDTSTFSSFSPKIKPVVFNVPSGSQNNGEGDSFRLRFQQIATTKTLTLLGFSVYYTDLSLRK